MLRRLVQFASVVGAVLGVGVVGAGCLDRPVTSSGATTKTNFTAAVVQNAIDKVDILFDIDNSASMGDKQQFLAAAVPDLITRLVQPNCVIVNGTSGTSMVAGLSNNGDCSMYAGSVIEFPPVHNMHLGVISSSLGTRGVTGAGAVCDPTSMTNPFNDPGMHPAISAHDDDRAELLGRTAMDQYTEGTTPDTGGQNFLDWFPTGTGWAINDPPKSATNGVTQATSPTALAISTATQLEMDFRELIIGSHYYGCGIESQLESWYRFLVQPDPYDAIVINNGLATWSGVDATILKQRHDFLRPDSLVAIIDLSDEDDSEIDVRSFGGQGYKFMDQSFQPPRGTSPCAGSPASNACTSCAYGGATASDPNCKMGPYTAADDPGFYINVRHVNMQQKYGIIPQYPLGRYVLGLTSPNVPDRDHEYPCSLPSGASCSCEAGTAGCSPSSSYQGGTVYSGGVLKDSFNLSCTNPLFANTLPDGSDLSPGALCNQSGAGGVRTPSLVYYAHIGGVPHQLLQTTPGDGVCPTGTNPADCPQKDSLKPTDWVNILGQGWQTPPNPPASANPNAYVVTGQNAHMIEAFEPRGGLVTLGTGPNPTGGGSDPINGGEWVTNGSSPMHALPVDREYACIFPLVDPTTGMPTPRDCTSMDYSVQEACDCSVSGLPLNAVPAVCGTQSGGPFAAGTNEYTKQYYAKAYPTTREITLVELLGGQGILSSLCPIDPVAVGGTSDPLFGYRPAVTAIVNRLKNALSTQCLPEQLTPIATKLPNGTLVSQVQCLVLATLADNPINLVKNTSMVCNNAGEGMSVPSSMSVNGAPSEASIVQAFQKAQDTAWRSPPNLMHGTNPSTLATCLVNQIPYTSMGSCASAGSGSPKGWCYVTDTKFTGQCAQAVQFTPGAPASGATVSLQCIEAQVNIVGGANDGGANQ